MANKKTKDIDYIVTLDDYSLTEEEQRLFETPKKREIQAKRWFLTLNNPFWTAEDEEVNPMNCDLEIVADHYNLDFCKSFNNIDLFEFHYIKVTAKVKEIQIEKVLKEVADSSGEKKYQEISVEKEVIVEKEIVVERPYFKSYDHFKNYLENLQIEGLKWSCGQVEKGKINGTIHLQFGVCFDETHGKRFYTMKKYFPTAYIAQARGSNFDILQYCTKEETRIEEPFQIGNISEMRTRNDISEFYAAIKAGASDYELMENFYGLVAQYGFEKINMQRDVYFNSRYRTEGRNIEITYIYGDAGVGKTSWVYKQFGFENVFSVPYYGKFMFNGYNGEKVLLLDEFDGQVNIQWLNKILDVYPLKLEIKGGERFACYNKVFIVSNKSYLNFYKNTNENNNLFETWYRRLHFIYRVDRKKGFILEKSSEFEEVPDDERKLKGVTKRIARSYRYNEYGYKYVCYDAHASLLEGKQEIEQEEMIFDE